MNRRQVEKIETRARAAIDLGDWAQATDLLDKLFKQHDDAKTAWFLRAMVFEHAGEPLMALLLLESAREDEVAYQEALDDDVDARSGFLEEVEQALTRVRGILDAKSAEARNTAGARALEWIERGCRGTLGEGARALASLCPAHEGVFTWLAGAELNDPSLRERACELVPDAPEAWWQLGIRTTTQEADLEALSKSRDLLRARAPKSKAATWIERLHAQTPLCEVKLLDAMANAAYDAEKFDVGVALADEWVALAPDSASGWEMRALARTFSERHEDAISAYGDAIREIRRINPLNKKQTLARLQFNLACELARLGRRDDALHELRQAVAADPAGAAEARTDDYFAALWDDPEFLAIMASVPENEDADDRDDEAG